MCETEKYKELEDTSKILEYTVPEEIKIKIPVYFYYAFGGELISVFGKDILLSDQHLEYYTETAGWAVAFNMACRKLNLNWLMKYRNSLPWYHADSFSDWIAKEVIKRIDKFNNTNPYYLYLLTLEENK